MSCKPFERRERVVTKDELLDLAWPGVVVEENNLQVQISTLRKLLGPQSIVTIPGRGYRFSLALDGTPGGATAAVGFASTTGDNNLPTQREPLHGREDDMRMVGELLHRHAQVSIVGAGGIGKTRLAQAVAAAQREHYPDGVWWVDLAALNDANLIVSAIAQALDAGLFGGTRCSERMFCGVIAGSRAVSLLAQYIGASRGVVLRSHHRVSSRRDANCCGCDRRS
jgi:hypothetical protein